MPKQAAPLSLKAIHARPEGRHAVGHVRGLCVQRSGRARSWILRAGGREMGLGSLADVGLQEAIDRAHEARKLLRDGIDPVERKRQLRAKPERAPTFAEVSRTCIAKLSPEWRNAKHAKQWTATLHTYADPIIGKLPVDRIETRHVLAVLNPIWETKTETATRVRQRIETVLDFAGSSGYRTGDNPARWAGHLENLLATPTKIAKVEHHEALPWADLPAFMVRLREVGGLGARALEFAIYTAARSGEVRGATWDEIDLDGATWTIPAARMKAQREHVVPLAAPALALLRALPRLHNVPFVFPSIKGTALSDMTLTAVLRRMKVDATTHGMRSSFRDWAAERTNYPREVCEMALAHTIPSAVEAAYRRGDLLAKRTRLMRAWAAYLATTGAAARVTPIRAAR